MVGRVVQPCKFDARHQRSNIPDSQGTVHPVEVCVHQPCGPFKVLRCVPVGVRPLTRSYLQRLPEQVTVHG